MKIKLALLIILSFNFANFTFPQVTQEWVNIYSNSPLSNVVSDMAIDSNNNVYIVGHSFVNWTNRDDGILIKYNSAGERLWVRTYNGNENQGDYFTGVVIDDQGYIYAAGHSNRVTTGYDAVLIKYNSNGDTIWKRFYNDDPKNWSEYVNDVNIDKYNNVYIAGFQYRGNRTSSSLILKYDYSGDLVWSNIHDTIVENSVNAVTTDDSSNVYASGFKTGSSFWSKFLLIKLDKFGTLQWARDNNNSGSQNSEGYDLIVDDSSNVLTTGRYDHNPGMNILNSYIISYMFKYDGTVRNYDLFGNIFRWGSAGRSIKIDHSNNILITGHETRNYGWSDDFSRIVTLKYNKQLNRIWNRTFITSGTRQEFGYSLALDYEDNVYVTGQIGGSNEYNDLVAVKYDSSGNEKWQTRYNGPGNMNDYGRKILLDRDDNVYVCGNSHRNSTGLYDIFVIKYSQGTIGVNNQSGIPSEFRLFQNYPNPFNPATIIDYELPTTNFVSLKIYGILGNEVITLVNEKKNSGSYKVEFNGTNLPSGVYYYKLESENFVETKKMILLK